MAVARWLRAVVSTHTVAFWVVILVLAASGHAVCVGLDKPFWSMSRKRSYFKVLAIGGQLNDAQANRLARDRKYGKPRDKECVFRHPAPPHTHGSLRAMCVGRLSHQCLADDRQEVCPAPKVLAYRQHMDGNIDRAELQSLKAKFKNADAGKHEVHPVAMPAAASGPLGASACLLERNLKVIPERIAWADACDDSLNDLSSHVVFPPLGAGPLGCGVARVHGALNPDAAEFSPQFLMPNASTQESLPPCADSTLLLPSIGMQLDFMLQSLLDKFSSLDSRLVAMERQMHQVLNAVPEVPVCGHGTTGVSCVDGTVTIAGDVSRGVDEHSEAGALFEGSSEGDDVASASACIGLGELFARVRAMESHLLGIDTKLSDVQSEIIHAVVGELPQLISPVVKQCIGASLELPLRKMQQSVVDNAMKVVKLELGLGGPPASGANNLHNNPLKVEQMKQQKAESDRCGVDVLDLEVGDAVIMHGLISSPQLNGETGIVVGFDAPSQRYMIRTLGKDGELSEKTMKLKRCNLVSASDVDDDEMSNNADD